MKNYWRAIIFGLLLFQAGTLGLGCSSGFEAKTSGVPSQQGPPPIPAPPPTQVPPSPPNTGSIACDHLAGHYATVTEICNYATQVKHGSCINYNGNYVCAGANPCTACISPDYHPPVPPPPPPPPPGSPPMGIDFEILRRAGFEFSASQGRTDGVMISINPVYNRGAWRLVETMSPQKCVAKGSPEQRGPEYIELATGDGFTSPFRSYLDERAPEGVYFCYMLIGRGVVEGVAWGYRVAKHQDQVKEKPPENGFVATRDRSEGVEIILNPPYVDDLSLLFVTGDEVNRCPKAGETFVPGSRRFFEVLSHFFNGKWAFDDAAAFDVDLCYVAVSRLDQRVLGSALGYRPHPVE